MKNKTVSDRIFDIINHIILTIALLLVLYPLIFIISASISDPNMVNSGKVIFFPKGLNFEGYKEIIGYKLIWIGYRNTIFYTIFGTIINLAFTLPGAYALSRKELAGRNIIMFIITFTMYFSGGLIPDYMVVRAAGLRNTIWSLMIPIAVSSYNFIVAKSYFQTTIPNELYQSAKIDGCSDFRMFFSIALPLSKAIIAVMSLFYGVYHWNQFFQALLYIDKQNLVPLQLVLRDILLSAERVSLMTLDDPEIAARQGRLVELMKFGIIIVSSLPVLIIYPFLQRYFIKGVMIGAIRG